LSPELKKLWGVTTIPFTMTLGDKDFTDDETVECQIKVTLST
jgi:hypothetical protein